MAGRVKIRTERERHPERYFDSPAGHPRDRIKIHETPYNTLNGMICLGLNGFHIQCKAEEEIDIPRPVRLMLDTLIQTETRRVDNGHGGYDVHTRNLRRFPYTLIKEDVTGILTVSAPEAIAAMANDAGEAETIPA